MIRFGHKHIDIEMTFPLISLLRQNVTRMRMATLDFPRGSQAHSLRCTLMGLEFWHSEIPLFRSLSIVDFQLPIAHLFPIGNWQSKIGNNLLSGRLRLRAAAAALMSLWPKNDEHLVAFHSWPRFNFTDVREILFQFLENARA